MKIINKTKQTIIAQEAEMADTFFSRMKGLLGRKQFTLEQALVITRCQSVHMFFMHFPIDVVFVNQRQCVVGIVQNLKPFQLSPIFWGADYVIELPLGSVAGSKISKGDQIEWQF